MSDKKWCKYGAVIYTWRDQYVIRTEDGVTCLHSKVLLNPIKCSAYNYKIAAVQGKTFIPTKGKFTPCVWALKYNNKNFKNTLVSHGITEAYKSHVNWN